MASSRNRRRRFRRIIRRETARKPQTPCDGDRPHQSSFVSTSVVPGRNRRAFSRRYRTAGSRCARLHDFYLLPSGIPFPKWGAGPRPAARLISFPGHGASRRPVMGGPRSSKPIERGAIEIPFRRRLLPDELRKVVPVFVVAGAAAFRGKIILIK